jgi:lipopolysaccharide/colanic/teichoic acid biosynthesis glycosyltransferase
MGSPRTGALLALLDPLIFDMTAQQCAYWNMIKRIFDFIAALAGLLLLAPLLIIISIAIKATSDGPAFYRGLRVGLRGKPFYMLKFRTMVINAEKLGGASTANDDVRITKVGSLLRAGKLDELPQLINVLSGEMSLVGPRPNVQFDVDLYSLEEREQLLSVRPGITDYASIVYSNEGAILAGQPDPDEAYNRLIRPGKIALQKRYIKEQSLKTDLYIIYLTIKTIAAGVFGFSKPQVSIPDTEQPPVEPNRANA